VWFVEALLWSAESRFRLGSVGIFDYIAGHDAPGVPRSELRTPDYLLAAKPSMHIAWATGGYAVFPYAPLAAPASALLA
jgi:hypothetical protein